MSKIVDRTLDFFELFASEQRPLTLSEIARLLGIPLSSCHDVVTSLRNRGYVYEVGPRAGFYPTLRLRDVTARMAAHDPMLQTAEDRLRRLRDELGESVALAQASGTRLVYLLVLDSPQSLRFQMVVGAEVRSHHATSAGKAYLGRLPDDALRACLAERELVPLTPHTMADAEAVADDIRRSEARGWFVNDQESVAGATTVSVRFERQGVYYVVTAAGPTTRVAERVDAIGSRLVEVCADLVAADAGPALWQPAGHEA